MGIDADANATTKPEPRPLYVLGTVLPWQQFIDDPEDVIGLAEVRRQRLLSKCVGITLMFDDLKAAQEVADFIGCSVNQVMGDRNKRAIPFSEDKT